MIGRIAAPAVACALALAFAALTPAAHAQPGPELPATPAMSDIRDTRERPPNLAAIYPDIYQQRPVIELVTMGIGALIWERHGHIALCVREADPRNDRCYNYGIGDFHHPAAMAWGFLRGTGAFWVGKSSVADMLSIYLFADRTIWVQPLRLTPEQTQQIIDKLEHDILDANRYYAYDHFWDNCTTRVRDVIDHAIGGKLAAMPSDGDDRTFRDLAREGFYGVLLKETGPVPVPLLITDIAMGRVTDRVPTYYERMFLPQYLREAVAKQSGVQPIAIYTRRGEPPSTDSSSGRGWFALAILIVTLPAWLTRWLGRLPRAGLALAVIPYVLLGTALTFLAIISPLPYVRWNELCLVLFPFDLLVLFLAPERRRGYARARLVMLGAILVLSVIGVLKQPLLTPLLWPAIPLAVVGLWRPPAPITKRR